MFSKRISRWRQQVAAVLCLVALSVCRPAVLSAGLVGSNFQISTTGGSRFPDVAYDSVDGKYLAIYTVYPVFRIGGRFVSAAGAAIGSEFLITDPTGGLYGAVAYNAASNEFLVTWDDQRSPFAIWGQRISGATGLPVGTNFQISTADGIRSAVAWSSTENSYLVVWASNLDIYGRRVSSLGIPLGVDFNISNDAVFSGYPAVAYGSNGNQYLVTWDNNADLHGQRVSAATGALLGGQLTFTGIGTKDRSCVTYDSGNSRWMVQYNQTGNPGNSYDQYGNLVTTSGSISAAIPFAATPEFEGDTQFGGDIACLPAIGRYFSSFMRDAGMGGRELDASGNGIGPIVTVGTGIDTSLNNAADTTNNRWLTVWERRLTESGPHQIYGQLYEPTDITPPAPVTNLAAAPASGSLTLSWTNPGTSDFTGTVIRYKVGSYPISANDGFLVVDKPNTPGSNDSYVHQGLSSGTTYFYAAFAHDAHPNYATAATVTGVPAAAGDFDVDGDVDIVDFAHLQLCFSGDTLPYGAGCANADIDVDGDVDIADFNLFDACMRGPNQTPGC